MLKIEDLKNLENLINEKESLLERINKLKNKERKIIIDGVRGSSIEFPYTQHTFKIEGLDNSITYRKRKNILRKLEKMLKQKQRKIDKKTLQIEYELNYIEDAEIRQIIRLKYFDNLNWIQVMYKMREFNKNGKYCSEDMIRMKLKRYFEKNIKK